MKKVAIIGAGFSGLSAAAYAAKMGYEVHVFEAHSSAGGRARKMITPEGFVFDMGPSWYWMPDVIENYFKDFGVQTKDFYELIALNPQFEIVFKSNTIQIPKSFEELKMVFENIEPGTANKLDSFMQSAKLKYQIGMNEFVNKPCYNWFEFMKLKIIKHIFSLNLFTNFKTYVGQYFKNEKLQAIMEFPVIFLGAAPNKIPALYSLMNYGGLVLGTHYPKGGFYKLVQAMQNIAEQQGVTFHFDSNVQKINIKKNRVTSLKVNNADIEFDSVIASSDYYHTETLLDIQYRNYTEAYWKSKTFAPSCLIFYLGFNEKLPNLKHHTLFFDSDFDTHIHDIYEDKKWPINPLFYLCCPSKTDDTVAPKNCENVFLLMPIANNLNDEEALREHYLKNMILRIEKQTGSHNLLSKIIYKKSYCVNDFKNDYKAYGGNAYGLANTLNQTAVLKPKIYNKKVGNLFYAGQLTVPGPGVPPSIISGKIAASLLNRI